MSQQLALSISVIVSLFLSTSISVVMMKPLRGVLSQLCPGAHATNFWMTFTAVMLYVTPLLVTLLFVGTVMVADSVSIIRTALASSLFGAFAALLVVGYQISRARPLPR
jgi:hypothetical protein